MTILFYTPFNNRSRDTESLMFAFMKQGHNVLFLSQTKSDDYVDFLQKRGIVASYKVFQKANKFLNWLSHIFFLISYCRKNKIDVVYSHLESANFIAVLAQYFIKAKVIVCRHHVDEIHLNGQEKSLSYYLIYKLARKIIVVSNRARNFMVEVENVYPNKIYKINLAYDFKLYDQVDVKEVEDIRRKFDCKLLIVTACRLVKDKRPELSVELIESLSKLNFDAKMLILGRGDMAISLNEQIKEKKLEDRCFLLGHQSNILDYLSAADIVFHPSFLDSSSVIVKEAGLVKKPVIVCAGVGDFDDYIVSGTNGVLVSKEKTIKEAVEFLYKFYDRKPDFKYLGENLSVDVNRLFSLENILPEYQKFNS